MSDSRICGNCGAEVPVGEWPWCPHGKSFLSSTNQAIHPSERTIVYRHPQSGEVKYPMRADKVGLVEQAYIRQGFVRETMNSVADVKAFERDRGVIHERSHWGPHGNN